MLGTITDVRIKYELQKKEQDAKELNAWLLATAKTSKEYEELKHKVLQRLI